MSLENTINEYKKEINNATNYIYPAQTNQMSNPRHVQFNAPIPNSNQNYQNQSQQMNYANPNFSNTVNFSNRNPNQNVNISHIGHPNNNSNINNNGNPGS